MQPTSWIWINGKLIRWEDATLHFLTHTLHYGTGVFEGIRCYETDEGPAIFRLKEHIERLFKSGEYLDMELPYTQQQIEDACTEVIQANKLPSAYIRPIVFYGYGKMGLDPAGANLNVAIAAWPWGPYLGEEELEKGVTAIIAKTRRFSGNHNHAKITGNYFNSMKAHNEAKKKGCHEAIMLDEHGFVAEGPGENIFIVKKGIILTPTRSAILQGITRDSVMNIARDRGYKVKERKITVRDLKNAHEAFFTGTAAEITPIRVIDKKEIGNGSAGGVTKELQLAFFAIVKGKNPVYEDWLTFC
ncbi:MAG: Branched-chain amino acid aminotransferase [Candidatus Woesebacteria bacterium GW2011_GWB1_45_5]|uniref:Branched-chain-amino-acid aminotransferase n=1 Tax=Candidatus Woesebacteria bacterium GW2011_GWB1_45_5 TaxID=1618581 RepID=A0A0G1MQS5_9BACT|nr:MAG: Branched-chain amino acid aminotransferase [Candidatus Woesebacteria bacterium GW2011_GWB1_45_5]